MKSSVQPHQPRLRRVLQPAEERLNQLTKELPKLQGEVDYLKVNTLSDDAVMAEARQLYDRWPTLPTDENRKIAEGLCQRIQIGRGEIEITLTYLPASEEPCKSQQQLRGSGRGPAATDSLSAARR